MKRILLPLLLFPAGVFAEIPMWPWQPWQQAAFADAKSGDFSSSLEKMENALRDAAAVLEADSPEMIPLLASLATAYRRLAQWDKAKDYANQAAILARKHQSDLGETLHALANIYRDSGEEAQAIHFYAEAQKLKPDRELSLDWARAVWTQGKQEEALKRYEDLLASESASGHWLEALMLEMGDALLKAKISNPARANDLYRKVLEDREKRLGAEHPDMAELLLRLGRVLRRSGAHQEADKILLRAETLRRKTMGPDSWQSLGSIRDMAEIYALMARKKESRELWQRCLSITEQALGKNHPRSIELRDRLK